MTSRELQEYMYTIAVESGRRHSEADTCKRLGFNIVVPHPLSDTSAETRIKPHEIWQVGEVLGSLGCEYGRPLQLQVLCCAAIRNNCSFGKEDTRQSNISLMHFVI